MELNPVFVQQTIIVHNRLGLPLDSFKCLPRRQCCEIFKLRKKKKRLPRNVQNVIIQERDSEVLRSCQIPVWEIEASVASDA